MAATASVDALVRVPVDRAFRVTVDIDPAAGFYPRFGPLPAVLSVSDRTGPFTRVGSSRMLHLSDGGTVTETVVRAEAPASAPGSDARTGAHSYRLTGFTGLFGRLVDHADADWRFEQHDGGTRIRWTYTFTGLPGRGGIVAVIVRLAWAPYMRRVLPGIAHEVARTA